jgi:gamma-glutamyltranspeptidase/glutathione hydrolase/leukotriene-C4 hydrolase
LIRKVRATGGILSHTDLENYTVKVDHALQGTYRGRKVYTSHAPTSGPGASSYDPTRRFAAHFKRVVLLHMLNLIEKFPMTARTPLNVHRAVEVLKFGFAARLVMTKAGSPCLSAEPFERTKICDPAFNNDTKRIDEIATKPFADLIAVNITDVSE